MDDKNNNNHISFFDFFGISIVIFGFILFFIFPFINEKYSENTITNTCSSLLLGWVGITAILYILINDYEIMWAHNFCKAVTNCFKALGKLKSMSIKEIYKKYQKYINYKTINRIIINLTNRKA